MDPSATKFLRVNIVSNTIVRHTVAYLFMQKWFVGDAPYYMKIWLKLTNPKNADI